MRKKYAFLITILTICMLCFGLCESSYAISNKSKSFSLIVSGAGVGNGDKDEMEKILKKNKLFSDNSIWTYTYDTEAAGIAAGTTKAEYNKAIDTAYKGCTINDTAYFFHSGHGMEGINKGWGIMLKTAYGGMPFSWYKYDDLLEKLSSVSCKHMVVIIHACESGAVKEAYDKLPQSKKNKISLFWSSGANQLSYKNSAYNVSVYGQTLIQLLGYDGNLYADTNNDGDVTVKELGNYINSYIGEVSKYVGAPSQTPGYTSAKNSNTVIYSYNSGGNKNTTKKASIKLNKSKATIYTSGNKTVQLKATVIGTSKKVTWKSSNKKIATVSSKGKVTAKKAGTATITAKANGKTATCKVTVEKPSIKLNKSKATIYTSGNKTIQLKATVKGASKKTTWKSNDPKIATVNSSGKITAKKAGTVTIIAKANGVTAKCKITVKKKNDTKSTDWKKIYKSFLSRKSTVISENGSSRTVALSSAYFTVGDINNDGIKELFVREGKDAYGNMTSTVCVFTIINGKVSWAGNLWNVGDAPEISKKYGGVHYTWYAAGCAHFYFASIKNGKLYMKADITRYSEPRASYYYVNGKEVSKSTFDKTLKSYEDSLVKVDKFAINNAFNREWTFG